MYYLTFWYQPHERAIRLSWFFAASITAGIVGGLLAFGISYLNGTFGLQGWRWIFILEGLPTVIMGVVVWIYLPNYPETCTFLSTEDREYYSKLSKDQQGDAEIHSVKTRLLATLKDPTTYVLCLTYFTMLVPL